MSKATDQRLVMWRDASFWNKPGRATRYHLPRTERGPYGHPVAICNSRIQLDEEHTSTVAHADRLMCKRCARAAFDIEQG